MKTLITGGLGFIGSHLAKRIPDAVIYDRKDPITLINFYQDYHTVFHLAASTYLTEGYDKQMIDDNIILSSKVFNKVMPVAPKKIVYASSAAIYNPNNLYSYSKKYCEDIAPPTATGLRYYNVYGYGDNGIVSKLIKSALTGSPITIYGGYQTRDFVYVDDVVQSTLDAVKSKEKIIEVGTGVETNIVTLIALICEITGKPISFNVKDRIEMEALNSCCPTPLKKFTPLVEGLKKTIQAYDNIL